MGMRSVFECRGPHIFRLRKAALVLGTLAAVSACSVDTVLRPEVDVGVQTATVTGGSPEYAAPEPVSPLPAYPPSVSVAPLPAQITQAPEPTSAPPEPLMTPPEPAVVQSPPPATQVAMAYPRIAPPPPQVPAARPPQTAAPVMPADELECRRDLKRLGVVYRDLPPIDDGGACRIDYPVQVSGLSGGIKMKPAATLTCQMAAAFALWTKRDLAPAARTRYFSGIDTIRQGSSYSCRRIRGTRVASEHSKGNALDVMSITLENGREIDVRRPGLFAFRQRSLLNKVRAEGCDYFTTVLGPGYNADHANHFHFDIKDRKNGYRACR